MLVGCVVKNRTFHQDRMLRIVTTCLVLIHCVFADISGNNPPCGKCLCADVSSTLNVRDAPGGSVVGSINNGDCYKYTGGKQAQGGYTWFSFDYNGYPNIWSAGEFLEYGSDSSCDASTGGDIAALSDTCLCVTATSLNARDSAGTSGNVVASLGNGECFTTTGDKQQANGYNWFKLNYSPSAVWAAGEFLEISCDENCASSSPPSSDPCSDVTIVSRSAWGARAPTGTTNIAKPVPHVFIHHTTGSGCTSSSSCESSVRGIQNYHMDSNRWSDIGYSFLIGGDGKVYEGRGWDRTGAHTSGYNSVGFGISFIGDYRSVVPSTKMLNAAKLLIQCGVKQGDIAATYSLSAHSDTKCTECPGAALYGQIATWDNWHKTPNFNAITPPNCAG